MFDPFRFDPAVMPEGSETLRAEVREFLAAWQPRWSPRQLGQSWMRLDKDFTRAVAARGWIGMTWPKAYGGGARSMLERYVVIEEMLAAGAPVGAHWISDRQSGPLILRLGTEAQKQHLLPLITRGEACFCIGLSEPGAGSDLAAVRTKAERCAGGWKINGHKIWTTNAHHSDYMIALVRTHGTADDRQSGLSQLLVDLRTPGIEIRRISDLTGEAHFNEVTFDDAVVSHDALIGIEGDGWKQTTVELAFERSGPDRFLSAMPLLDALAAEIAAGEPDRLSMRGIGQIVAELAVLRRMSVSLAGMLERGEMPNLEAAVIKELGVELEQRVPDLVRSLSDGPVGRSIERPLSETHAMVLQVSPTFSLRGGTREIIRGIIARGLGLR